MEVQYEAREEWGGKARRSIREVDIPGDFDLYEPDGDGWVLRDADGRVAAALAPDAAAEGVLAGIPRETRSWKVGEAPDSIDRARGVILGLFGEEAPEHWDRATTSYRRRVDFHVDRSPLPIYLAVEHEGKGEGGLLLLYKPRIALRLTNGAAAQIDPAEPHGVLPGDGEYLSLAFHASPVGGGGDE